MAMPDAELIGTWDSRSALWAAPGRERRVAWLKRHGLPADEMYRAEFYQGDAPFIRVFTYHRNEDGRRHWGDEHVPGQAHYHDKCGIAVNPPYDVSAEEFPPAALLSLRG